MWLKKILFIIWAYSPVFALTDDYAFLVRSFEKNVEHKYYFSIISFLLGEKKIQLFSFPIGRKDNRIEVFRIIKLSKNLAFNISESDMEEKVNSYKNHLSSLKQNETDVEKESLLRHLSDEKERIQTSYNKINAFTSIILTVIPLAIAFIEMNSIVEGGFDSWIFFGALIYGYVNLCAWIFQAAAVRSFSVSSFKDLKISENKEREYNCQIYYDWQQTKRKADMYVSFVKYTKNWIIVVIVLTVGFYMHITLANNNVVNSEVNTNEVYKIQTELITKEYQEDAQSWNLFLADLNSDKSELVIILYNYVNINSLKEKLQGFKHQKFIYIKDNDLRKNEIKIIIGEQL